jgi:hypothetical protein
MPEITIYTNDGDCANGVAEINPFTVGDATDDWTLKFNDGNDFYSPSNVTMRVGHTNGLPDGTYINAFKWIDRTGAESLASINLANGVPALTFNTDPVGGVVGTDGVYILRGPQLDGAITSIDILEAGQIINAPSSSDLIVDGSSGGFLNTTNPSGTSYASAYATSGINNPDIEALIGQATWFDKDGLISGSKISLTDAISFPGDFNMLFKKLKLFDSGSQDCIASGVDPNSNAGTFFLTNGAGQYSIKFYSDLTDSEAIVRTVTLNLNNWFLIQQNTEYDYTIKRSGLTWTLSVSLNGLIIASGTATGSVATNLPFYISSIGLPSYQLSWGAAQFSTALYGILRELKFFDSSNTLIHYYAGNGGGAQNWIDLIGNNNALTNGTTFYGQTYSGSITSAVVRTGGSGFTAPPRVVYFDPRTTGSTSFVVYPLFKANGNWAEYEFPFMRDESGNDIIAGTALSPYSDGKITNVTQYDHSTLVIRPETVDNASLTQSGLDWVGTMNPVNAYVNSRLSLRNSTQLDIQIRGDDRTLFQGQLTILNKIN